jgi:hypothetical protein
MALFSLASFAQLFPPSVAKSHSQDLSGTDWKPCFGLTHGDWMKEHSNYSAKGRKFVESSRIMAKSHNVPLSHIDHLLTSTRAS